MATGTADTKSRITISSTTISGGEGEGTTESRGQQPDEMAAITRKMTSRNWPIQATKPNPSDGRAAVRSESPLPMANRERTSRSPNPSRSMPSRSAEVAHDRVVGEGRLASTARGLGGLIALDRAADGRAIGDARLARRGVGHVAFHGRIRTDHEIADLRLDRARDRTGDLERSCSGDHVAGDAAGDRQGAAGAGDVSADLRAVLDRRHAGEGDEVATDAPGNADRAT